MVPSCLTVHDPGATHRVSGEREADEVLLGIETDEKGSRLGHDLPVVQRIRCRAACGSGPTGPTRESPGGRPCFAPEVMMSRRHELRRRHRFWSALAHPENETPVTEQVTAERRLT
jgi:hypothetical protein